MAWEGEFGGSFDRSDPATLGFPAGEIDSRFAFVGAVVGDPEFAFVELDAGVAGVAV